MGYPVAYRGGSQSPKPRPSPRAPSPRPSPRRSVPRHPAPRPVPRPYPAPRGPQIGRPLIPNAAKPFLPLLRGTGALSLLFVAWEIYDQWPQPSGPGDPVINPGWTEKARCNPDNWDEWGRVGPTTGGGWNGMAACGVVSAHTYANHNKYALEAGVRYAFFTLSANHAVTDTGISHQGGRGAYYTWPASQGVPAEPPYTIPNIRPYYLPAVQPFPWDPMSNPLGVPYAWPRAVPTRDKFTWPFRPPWESPEVGPEPGPWGPRPRPDPDPRRPPTRPPGPPRPPIPFRWPLPLPDPGTADPPEPQPDVPWPVERWLPWPWQPDLSLGIDLWVALGELPFDDFPTRPLRRIPQTADPHITPADPAQDGPGVWVPSMTTTRTIVLDGVAEPQVSRPPPPNPPLPAPPARGEKERKVMAPRPVLDLIRGAFHEVTEINDVVQALHDALPSHLRVYRGGMAEKWQAVLRHWRHIDVSQALTNVFLNQVEDRAYGDGFASRRELGRTVGRRRRRRRR